MRKMSDSMRWLRGALAVLALLALPAPAWAGPPAEPRPNVVLFFIDTLRADHLGCYAYRRPTSPRLDSLAARGTLFEAAMAQADYSLPSYATLFTSLYPGAHGVTGPGTSIPPGATTLAEIFSARGYHTGAFSGGIHLQPGFGFARGFEVFGTTPRRGSLFHTVPAALQWLEGVAHEPFFLFVQGYDCHLPYTVPLGYSELYDPAYDGVVHQPGFLALDTLEGLDGLAYDPLVPAAFRTFPDRQTMGWRSRRRRLVPGFEQDLSRDLVRQWVPPEPEAPGLEQSAKSGPESETVTASQSRTALPARLPHWRRQLASADVAHLVAHYDGAVTYADTWLGIFVESLRQRGLLENTLLIVAGDHGEELGERGRFGHGRLHLDELRVPLVVAGPGVEPARRVTDTVGLIDLAPTLLELCTTPPFHGHQGKSLAPYLQAAAEPPRDPSRAAFCTSTRGVSIRSGRWHLSRRTGTANGEPASWSLHDAILDPAERSDLSAAHPEVAATLRSRLLDWMEQVKPPVLVSPSSLGAREREGLRRSGYW